MKTTDELKQLIELAKKATPGKWIETDAYVVTANGQKTGKFWTDHDSVFRNKFNRAFVAAINPTTAIEILEELLQLKQQLGKAMEVE